MKVNGSKSAQQMYVNFNSIQLHGSRVNPLGWFGSKIQLSYKLMETGFNVLIFLTSYLKT